MNLPSASSNLCDTFGKYIEDYYSFGACDFHHTLLTAFWFETILTVVVEPRIKSSAMHNYVFRIKHA